jgi:hypothetical protein
MDSTSLADIDWFTLLSHWSLLAGVAYLALFALILTIILPSSKSSALPEKYFELIAAYKRPKIYRLTILFDVVAWVAIGGFLVTCVGLLAAYSPVRSLYIALLATGVLSGIIGACLRLVETPRMANTYHKANSDKAELSIVESYEVLLNNINTLFSVGGLLVGAALVAAMFGVWSISQFSHWVVILLGLAGAISVSKGALELVTGKDWGPLGLLSGIMMIVAFFALALRFW